MDVQKKNIFSSCLVQASSSVAFTFVVNTLFVPHSVHSPGPSALLGYYGCRTNMRRSRLSLLHGAQYFGVFRQRHQADFFSADVDVGFVLDGEGDGLPVDGMEL